MRIASLPLLVFAIVATVAIAVAVARPVNSQELIEVGARFQAPLSHAKGETRNAVDRPPAVIWLTPLDSGHTPAPDRSRKYTLLQKNKEFTPHVLVVPVGGAPARGTQLAPPEGELRRGWRYDRVEQGHAPLVPSPPSPFQVD